MSDKVSIDIYGLKLHAQATIFDRSGNVLYHVIRVPGGWLYNGVFVPMNKEFHN